VRIFTPGAELPFAGHPTIGTAHALLEAGRIAPRDGVVMQECAAGLVRLDVTHAADGARWIAFELPATTITPLDAAQADELARIVGTPLAGIAHRQTQSAGCGRHCTGDQPCTVSVPSPGRSSCAVCGRHAASASGRSSR
jgi:PhzF family phenazine biosynthesis protein